ncbi:hypothetical protein OJ997_29075 [Solirubrobacter phytolaccae]|uniref:Uncharacterized protein n=1 Tax=Solirubrobacter phytolaccae TaxID=1404360 RepID=A0A9X3NMX5_9ACTN|nr:hypothetical protein [Solirubrobacter phytolaccae]MDA0184392.1 hypothetical protein [Solirubrobacter phytolaccae]
MRLPVLALVAVLVAGCSSSAPRPRPTASPTPSAAPERAAAGAVPRACPVSSARSDGAVEAGGSAVSVSEKPLALVTDGVAKELPARGTVDLTALACSADGRVALGWIEHRGERVQRLRLAVGERVVTLVRSSDYDGLNPFLSGLALAFEPDGELLVAYGERGRVRAVTVSRAGKLGRRVTLGRTSEYTSVVAEVAANGRAVVAWATEDSGLQVDLPILVRAATRDSGRLFGEARTVDKGTSVDPDEGAPLDLVLAVSANGRAALMWNDVTGSYKRGGFRHPVLVGSLDGKPRRVAAHGEIRDVAIRDDGTVLAVFVSRGRLRAAVGDSDPVDLGAADSARASFDADGRGVVEFASGKVVRP